MQHSSFCPVHSPFRTRYSSSRSSSAGCTSKFSHSILSIWQSSFCFKHSTLRISLASLHCTFNFLNCSLIRWSSTYSNCGLNWPSPAPLTIRSKDFVQERGRETFSFPDSNYSWHFLSNMADRQPTSSSTSPPPAASLSEVNIISLMFLKGISTLTKASL